MAQNILCDLCESEPALLMQTNIQNGDAITVGESCMLVFLLTTVSSIVDEMPADNAAQYGETLAPIVSKLAIATIAVTPAEGAGVPDAELLADDGEMQAAHAAMALPLRVKRASSPPAPTLGSD
jgi:hypothetical protein